MNNKKIGVIVVLFLVVIVAVVFVVNNNTALVPVDNKDVAEQSTEAGDNVSEIENVDIYTEISKSTEIEDIEADIKVSNIEDDLGGLDDINLDFDFDI